MIGRLLLLAGVPALLLLSAAPTAAQDRFAISPVTVSDVSAVAQATLALTNVTLIDGTGTAPRPRMTVLIHGDWIAGVFPAGHLPMLGWTRDSVATGLERMLHAGITTVREMAGDTRLNAELVRAGLIEGAPFPSIHYAVRMAGPTFYEIGAGARSWIGYEPGTAPWAQAVTERTDVARAVAVAAATGATGVKIYADLNAEVIRRIVDEAHRQGLKAWAHATVFPAGPLDLVRAGVDGLSHACFLTWGQRPSIPTHMADRPFELDAMDVESRCSRTSSTR